MKKYILRHNIGPIISFLWGEEVNFEGWTEKSRFDKGGNKVWPKYGKKELRIRPGGIRFLII